MKHQEKDFNRILQGERRRILKSLASLQSNNDCQAPDNIDYGDFAQTATEVYNNSAHLICLESELTQIQEALGRISEGMYRVCCQCGQVIDAARRQARPSATLCIDCKRKEQKKSSSYVNPSHC